MTEMTDQEIYERAGATLDCINTALRMGAVEARYFNATVRLALALEEIVETAAGAAAEIQWEGRE